MPTDKLIRFRQQLHENQHAPMMDTDFADRSADSEAALELREAGPTSCSARAGIQPCTLRKPEAI